MIALILNSGRGSRMDILTAEHPKCMTEISPNETILSRQLKQIVEAGIEKVVITTGYKNEVLTEYCNRLDLPLDITFVHNDAFMETNYIYSIYLAREFLQDDILLMHGDLVVENTVFDEICEQAHSCMTVSTTLALPQKDFKAVVEDGTIQKVGIEFFDNAVAAQPLYHLKKEDWCRWLDNISAFCESGATEKRTCYAENALNELNGACNIKPFDFKDRLCAEIDTPEDLKTVSERLKALENRLVYLCFSTDILHGGHIALLKKARRLGRLIVGVLNDETVASYKRFRWYRLKSVKNCSKTVPAYIK